MIVSSAMIGVLTVLFWLRREHETRHIALLQITVSAALLASIYIVPWARKSVELGSTYVFRFNEVFFDPHLIIVSIGWAFTLCVLAGLLVTFTDRRANFQPVLPCAVLVLVALFVIFEYCYRPLAHHLFGHDYVAFTPSRFLTDLTCFLSVYAGLFLLRVRERLHQGRTIIIVSALVVSLTLLPRWFEIATPAVPDGFVEAGEWIRANTSPDTIVLSVNPFASYVTWRRTLLTPLPISEPLDRVVPRQLEVRDLISGARPPSSPEMKLIGISFPGSDAAGRVLWRHPSGFAVVEIWPLAPRRD